MSQHAHDLYVLKLPIFQARGEEAQLAPARVGDLGYGSTHGAAAVPAAPHPLHGVPRHRGPRNGGLPPLAPEGAAVQAQNRGAMGHRARRGTPLTAEKH